ncbi:uncharacterized protein LOC129748533 [Uranotaenia lowii]|uniref:uncharacterized protein LOC129748533 n=1 Tax=Uranotaenia lowii TaxID=190385 RepID=UPI002478E538|nr:uncharacterized protein LOC129748533 [Uranotaenia lowii]
MEEQLLSSPSKDSSKKAANSPVTNDDKKQRKDLDNLYKITLKRNEGFIDEGYFDSLSTQLVNVQLAIPEKDPQPIFVGSGFLSGKAWFHAADSYSLQWLKSTVATLHANGRFADLVVLPFMPVSPLRRATTSVPSVPRLERDGRKNFRRIIAKQNKNLDIYSWKIVSIRLLPNGRYCVIFCLDEDSVSQLEARKFSVYYSLSQISIKVHAKKA